MENSATKLLDVLQGIGAYSAEQNPNASVGEALHAVIKGETHAHSLGEFWRLIVQTRDAVKANESISNHSAYLRWYQPVINIVTLPTLGQQVRAVVPQIDGDSTCVQFLTICVDQIRNVQARSISADELKALRDAAHELNDLISQSSGIDAQSRRTLHRILRLLLDAIESYGFGGPEELRMAIERFVGGVVTVHPLFVDFQKKSVENASAFKKLSGVIGRVLTLIKPVTEAVSHLKDLADKFELLSDNSGGGAGPEDGSPEIGP